MKSLKIAQIAMIQVVYHVQIQIIVSLVPITIHYLTIILAVFLINLN